MLKIARHFHIYFFFLHRGVNCGHEVQTGKYTQIKYVYCTISTTYIDNRKARSKNLK